MRLLLAFTLATTALLLAAALDLEVTAGGVRLWAHRSASLAWDEPVTVARGLVVVRVSDCCWGMELK